MELKKAEYSAKIMDLIYFYQKVERTWARIDLKTLDDLIEILRYYRQFAED